MGTPIKLQPADLKHLEAGGRSSFLYAMMKAISNDQSSMQNSQIISSVTTELAAKIQTAIYAYYNNSSTVPGTLAYDVQKLQDAAARGDTNSPDGTVYWNTKFNEDSATAQGCEGAQQGVVEDCQAVVPAISQELGVIVTSGQGLMSYMSAGSNYLGNVVN